MKEDKYEERLRTYSRHAIISSMHPRYAPLVNMQETIEEELFGVEGSTQEIGFYNTIIIELEEIKRDLPEQYIPHLEDILINIASSHRKLKEKIIKQKRGLEECIQAIESLRIERGYIKREEVELSIDYYNAIIYEEYGKDLEFHMGLARKQLHELSRKIKGNKKKIIKDKAIEFNEKMRSVLGKYEEFRNLRHKILVESAQTDEIERH